MVADYATTGLTTGRTRWRCCAPRCAARGLVDERRPAQARARQPVRIGGLVVARQRPGTARGIVFMLLEDEHGTINLVVPPAVYERHRLVVRTEPLVVADGRLERHPAGGGRSTSSCADAARRLDRTLARPRTRRDGMLSDSLGARSETLARRRAADPQLRPGTAPMTAAPDR